MLLLVTYDINTKVPGGIRRLYKVSKTCSKWGQRVQGSVIECLLDNSQFGILKAELAELIDPTMDKIRFYNLGNHYWSRIEQMGTGEPYDPVNELVI